MKMNEIEKCPKCGCGDIEIRSVRDESKIEITNEYPFCICLKCEYRFSKYEGKDVKKETQK